MHEPCAAKLEAIAAKSEIVVPDYFYIEVVSGLRHLDRLDLLLPSQLQGALSIIPDLPFTVFATANLVDEIWAMRYNISSYDAGYVSLAKSLQAALISHDTRLKNAVGSALTVISLKD